jgi:hypothetical protein
MGHNCNFPSVTSVEQNLKTERHFIQNAFSVLHNVAPKSEYNNIWLRLHGVITPLHHTFSRHSGMSAGSQNCDASRDGLCYGMAQQITAVVRQWLSSDHMVTPRE